MPHKWIRSPWCVLLISVLYASQIRCTQLSKDRTHVLDIVCNGEVSVKTREEGTDSDGCLQAAVYQKCGMSQHKCDLRHNYCDPTGTCYPCTKICSSKEETKFACSHHCKVHEMFQRLNGMTGRDANQTHTISPPPHASHSTKCLNKLHYYQWAVTGLVVMLAVSVMVNIGMGCKCAHLLTHPHTYHRERLNTGP